MENFLFSTTWGTVTRTQNGDPIYRKNNTRREIGNNRNLNTSESDLTQMSNPNPKQRDIIN